MPSQITPSLGSFSFSVTCGPRAELDRSLSVPEGPLCDHGKQHHVGSWWIFLPPSALHFLNSHSKHALLSKWKKKKMVHYIRNSFFVYKCGPRQRLPSLRSLQTGSPSAPLGQRQPRHGPPPATPFKGAPGPQATTCHLPATCHHAVSCHPGSDPNHPGGCPHPGPCPQLAGRPRRVILISLHCRCAPETLPDLAV